MEETKDQTRNHLLIKVWIKLRYQFDTLNLPQCCDINNYKWKKQKIKLVITYSSRYQQNYDTNLTSSTYLSDVILITTNGRKLRNKNDNEEKKKIKGDWRCSGGKWQFEEGGLNETKQKVKNPLKIMMW